MMTSTTLTELTKALRNVAATVVKDGALDAAGVVLPAFMDQDKAALKDKVRQSLVDAYQLLYGRFLKVSSSGH